MARFSGHRWGLGPPQAHRRLLSGFLGGVSGLFGRLPLGVFLTARNVRAEFPCAEFLTAEGTAVENLFRRHLRLCQHHLADVDTIERARQMAKLQPALRFERRIAQLDIEFGLPRLPEFGALLLHVQGFATLTAWALKAVADRPIGVDFL